MALFLTVYDAADCIGGNKILVEDGSAALLLGIFSSTATMASDNSYCVYHRDRWYINTVREQLGITASGHSSSSSTEDQRRLKITTAADVATVKNLLERHAYSIRNVPDRTHPCAPLNDRGFVRAWVELHSCVDVAYVGRERLPTRQVEGIWYPGLCKYKERQHW